MATSPTVIDLGEAAAPQVQDVLYGRARESEVLRHLLASGGDGCVSVLLEGAWGSGKTELLREALAGVRQDQDVLVLSAALDPLERGLPFGLVRRFSDHLSPWDAPEPAAANSVAEPDPVALDDLYGRLVRSTGGRRLVLAVDDLQRADARSLRWLRYVLRRGAELPLVLLATLGEEGVHPNADVLAGVVPLFRHRMTLGGLAEDAVDALAEDVLGRHPGRAVAPACREATGGNPLLLRALLRGLRDAGTEHAGETSAARITEYVPADVGPALLARLEALAPHAATVATAAAVLGGVPDADLNVDLLVEATALDEPQVEDALHALVRAECLTRTGPDGTAFGCAALAAAVASTVLPSRRMALHRAAARFLRSRGASAQRIAVHLLPGPRGEAWAPEVLAAAAERAAEEGRTTTAAAYLRRALREETGEESRAGLLASLGRLELASSVPVAVRSLESSLRLSRNPVERTAVARRLAGAMLAVDRYPEALEVLRRTSENIREADPADALRLEIDRIHIALTNLASAPDAVERLMGMNVLDAPDNAVRRPLAALLSLRAVMVGRCPEEAVSLAELALVEGADPLSAESFVHVDALVALRAAGGTVAALEHADAAVRQAQARGSVLGRLQALSVRANLAGRVGRLADSQADAVSALEELRAIDIGPAHSVAVFATATSMDSLVRQGKPEDAEGLLHYAGLDDELNANWVNDHVLMVRGRLRVAQGRLDEGLADFLLCGERAVARGMSGPGFHSWRSEAALVQAALRRGAAARSLAEEELGLARTWGTPEAVGTALTALGVVLGGGEGLDLLREAVGVLEDAPARLRYAQALADCGVLARKAGRLPEARTCLQRAASVADECGAAPLVDLALAELRAVGDRPRTRTFHGVNALTPTERRVADLALQGMTNREIAQHLFVGLRTVEVHLTNVYGKLAIDGRSGLPTALASTGGGSRDESPERFASGAEWE
ncbi:AAA family ATPase [Streptomyces sp. SP17BM10]|uniref:AAA family ATPase n=1 Tax=Streptomyces sp. SP17BM10 TaxID=3002530 RepID=UPI002E796D46|nr:AAA family ATPase [Streptomyces sp. SP17BM10]MEE1781439.1 AAA family ATPase [Streptomyces sp. SP17BM10]